MSDTPGFDLVTAAQAGDSAAFGELWRRYQPAVQRFIARRVTDRGLVEDLTSEVFLRGWLSIGTLHDRGQDVGAWFTTIARNKIKDHYKSPSHTAFVVPAHPIESWTPGLGTTPGPDTFVPDQHGRAAIAARLDEYVARLGTAHQREAVRLRFTEDMTGDQISQLLGCTPAGARRAYHRAAHNIREWLAAEGITSSAQFAATTNDPVRAA